MTTKTTAAWLCYCGFRNKPEALLCGVCDSPALKAVMWDIGDLRPKLIAFVATALEDASPGRFFRVRRKPDDGHPPTTLTLAPAGYQPTCMALVNVLVGDVVAVAPDFSAAPITSASRAFGDDVRSAAGEMDPFDEAAADTFDKAMADGDVGVVTEGGGLVPGAVFESYSDPSDPSLDGEWVSFGKATPQSRCRLKDIDRSECPFAFVVDGSDLWAIVGSMQASHTWHGWREHGGELQILVRAIVPTPRPHLGYPDEFVAEKVFPLRCRTTEQFDQADEYRLGDRWVDYDEAHEFALNSFKALDRAENPFAGQYKPGTGYDPISGVRPGSWTILRSGGAVPPDVDRTHTWHGWRERDGRIEILVRQRTDFEEWRKEIQRAPLDDIGRRMAEIHVGHEGDTVPEDAEITTVWGQPSEKPRPGLTHEPDPRCDCGNQKLGGRCNDPCPAAVPFHRVHECNEHGLYLEDLVDCGGCKVAAYCPGCQKCLACGERNDDGAHRLPHCEDCSDLATLAIHPEMGTSHYVCTDHLAGHVRASCPSEIQPIDVDRSTARALKARDADTPF